MTRPPRYPWLFLRICLAWLAVPIAIRFFPFPILLRMFSPSRPASPDSDRLFRILPYLDHAERRLPLGGGRCLRRCLVLFYFLNRYGSPVTLRIGAARPREGTMMAHSWLTKPDGSNWGREPGGEGYIELVRVDPAAGSAGPFPSGLRFP